MGHRSWFSNVVKMMHPIKEMLKKRKKKRYRYSLKYQHVALLGITGNPTSEKLMGMNHAEKMCQTQMSSMRRRGWTHKQKKGKHMDDSSTAVTLAAWG